MVVPPNPRVSGLLKMVDAYFGNNKVDSKFAETSLSEKTISGEDFIYLLNELEIIHKNELQDKINRIEELEKEYEKLTLTYDDLSSQYEKVQTYVEKYRPLIEGVVSVLERTAKREVRRLMNKKDDGPKEDDLPF